MDDIQAMLMAKKFQKERQRKYIIIIFFVVVVPVFLMIFAHIEELRTDRVQSQKQIGRAVVVATFAGDGGSNTRPFEVSGGWEVRWDASGSLFQLYLYSANGSLKGLPANQGRPGKGSSYQPKGGRYYLQVNAIGGWTIEIVDLPD